jgi:hypothetical protein
MRPLAILILGALAACDTATDVPGDATLANVVCVTAGNGITVTAAVDVAIDEGQAVMVDVDLVDSASVTASTIDETWDCATWSPGSIGFGCQRDPGQPSTATISVEHQRTITQGTLPASPQVAVIPTLFSADHINESAQRDEVIVDCTTP